MEVPPNGWQMVGFCERENPIKRDDLGVPLWLRKPPDHLAIEKSRVRLGRPSCEEMWFLWFWVHRCLSKSCLETPYSLEIPHKYWIVKNVSEDATFSRCRLYQDVPNYAQYSPSRFMLIVLQFSRYEVPTLLTCEFWVTYNDVTARSKHIFMMVNARKTMQIRNGWQFQVDELWYIMIHHNILWQL